jgi:hypothetical protein
VDGRAVALPPSAERVWCWFWKLDRTRNGNGYAADRIGYPEIKALVGERADEWEMDAIIAMDAIRLSGTDQPEAEPEGPPMTLAMFKEWVE